MTLKSRGKKADQLGTLKPKKQHSGVSPGFLFALQTSELLLKKLAT